MNPLIKILVALLGLVAVAAGGAWLYARDQQAEADQMQALALRRTIEYNAACLANSISRAEKYYASDLEFEEKIYSLDLRIAQIARSELAEQMVKTGHEAKLLRLQLKHDAEIAAAKEKYR